ncbi:SDR family oxidoreductase [Dongia sp. agr-C8]
MAETPRHILLTGASGGIGAATAAALAARGSRLTLVARDPARLRRLADRLAPRAAGTAVIAADLGVSGTAARVIAQATEMLGGIDVLVNCAGVNDFGRFTFAAPERIEALIATNLLAPIQLCRAALPGMLAQGRGRIVNVGSVMGGVGFAGFGVYCASKFGLRGFSEALRRELRGSGVSVTYVAPRYTRTALNTDAMDRMAQDVRMNTDAPETAAGVIAAAVFGTKTEHTIGAMERLLVRLNGLLPGVVDRSLATLNRRMLDHADEAGGIVERRA